MAEVIHPAEIIETIEVGELLPRVMKMKSPRIAVGFGRRFVTSYADLTEECPNATSSVKRLKNMPAQILTAYGTR